MPDAARCYIVFCNDADREHDAGIGWILGRILQKYVSVLIDCIGKQWIIFLDPLLLDIPMVNSLEVF